MGDCVSGLKGTSAVLPSREPAAAAREQRGCRARLRKLGQAAWGRGGARLPGVRTEVESVKGRASIKTNRSSPSPPPPPISPGRGAYLRQRARRAGSPGGSGGGELTLGTASRGWGLGGLLNESALLRRASGGSSPATKLKD